ncbi:MAG: hypothetical protein WC197_06775 [Candidatus Gastranaerophilaceae bacterium]|jgi:hypothetical protein
MELKEEKRTITQNNALHLFFTLLAEELNNAGLDMRKTLKQEVEIPWSPQTIKEYLWRPIQIAAIKKQSTIDLNSNEVDIVWNILNRHLGEKFGIYVPFPSEETKK